MLDIARQRLRNQHLTGPPLRRPEDVVRWMGAIQAQDYPGGLWSIGLRMEEATETVIEQAVAAGRIVRTWPMRGTLHFVLPEDVRWMLNLLAPRVVKKLAGYYRKAGLDRPTFARSRAVLGRALRGGAQLTRKELYGLLERAGISTSEMRGLFILGYLAMDGFLIFGPRRGKQHTLTLLEAWVPPVQDIGREEALGDLVKRYFISHGPATVQDLMWWSGLTAGEARTALAMSGSGLQHAEMGGKTYWFAPGQQKTKKGSIAHFLQAYDEYIIAYRDRSAAIKATPAFQTALAGGFYNTIVVDGRVVATWKRSVESKTVLIETRRLVRLTRKDTLAIKAAADRYGRFLAMPVRLSGI